MLERSPDMAGRPGRKFFHAAELGDTATIRQYLAQQVNLSQRDKNGNTALMLACSAGNCLTARLLLESGADVRQVNHQGETALALAAQEAHPRVVRLLLRHGATWENSRAGNRRALALFNPENNSIIRSDLHAWIDDHDRPEPVIRLNRIKRLLQGVIHILANAGADVNLRGIEGMTPLILCCTHGYHLAVQVLLSHGADPNLKSCQQWPLMEAVHSQHDDCARILLAAGANPNIANEYGLTPLMVTAYQNSLQMALELIARGADVTARDNMGKNSLHHAVSHSQCSKELVDALLAAGAQHDVPDNHGFTPLDRYLHKTVHGRADGTLLPLNHDHLAFITAARKGDAVRLASFDINSIPKRLLTHALVECVFEGHDACCHLLIQRGADPNGFSIGGTVPLIAAVLVLRLSTAGLLVGHGADPNSKDDSGHTALLALCQYVPDRTSTDTTRKYISETTCKLARFLLEQGADPNSTNTDNWTPLRQVVLNSGDLSLAWLLLAYGADMQIRDDAGVSPVEYAEQHCCQEMLDLLRTAVRMKI